MKRHAEQIGWLAETSSGGCTASDLLPHPAASAASDLSTLQPGPAVAIRPFATTVASTMRRL